jgi:hypothetical protein
MAAQPVPALLPVSDAAAAAARHTTYNGPDGVMQCSVQHFGATPLQLRPIASLHLALRLVVTGACELWATHGTVKGTYCRLQRCYSCGAAARTGCTVYGDGQTDGLEAVSRSTVALSTCRSAKGCDCRCLSWRFGAMQRKCEDCDHPPMQHYSHFNR